MSRYYYSVRYADAFPRRQYQHQPVTTMYKDEEPTTAADNSDTCTDNGAPCCASRSYATLKPNDALAHLNEQLAAECERYERDTGLLVASVKVTRDKEADTLKSLRVHVR